MSKALVIKGADFSTNKLATIVISDPVPCTGLTMNKSTASLTSLGATETLSVTKTPADTTDAVTWSTSDSSVATVANGVVTAAGIGTATITATCGQQTATCTVSVSISVDYVLVAGYNPERRSSYGNAATLGKRSNQTDSFHVLAANNANTSVLPIESKDNIDTGTWRFVPIVIPQGVTGFTITSEYEFKVRMEWFDNTRMETTNNKGAYCVEGITTDGGYSGWDQEDYVHSAAYTIPSTTGLNSFCASVLLHNAANTVNSDYASDITITFTMA